MRIALVTPYSRNNYGSMAHLLRSTLAALGDRHQVQSYPLECLNATLAQQIETLTPWVRPCDVILGPLDEATLQARQRADHPIPYLCFLQGSMSRGALRLAAAHDELRTTDVLVGNCQGDVAICAKFFRNATTAMVPFAMDENLFFPEGPEVRAATRARLGLGPADKLVVYAGRITLEKNLHMLLKAFRVLHCAVPTAHLVIAGSEVNQPFSELGVFPLNLKRMLHRTIAHLELDPGAVSFVGQRTAAEVRALYGAADVVVNPTLNHDENFGLPPIEAMACGTPVMGTAWGGLKDTIVGGETGLHISTVLTETGVKANWWEAANALVELFTDERLDQRLRARGPSAAHDGYSLEAYRQRLEDLLAMAMRKQREPAEPLQATAFGERFWRVCGRGGGESPMYRRGAEAFALYRELIGPYAASIHLPANGSTSFDPGSIFWLPSPLVLRATRLAQQDPIFPLEVDVPADLVDPVARLVGLLEQRPVIAVDECFASLPPDPAVRDAVVWLHDRGLLLTSQVRHVDPRIVPSALGRPGMAIQQIDHTADIAAVV